MNSVTTMSGTIAAVNPRTTPAAVSRTPPRPRTAPHWSSAASASGTRISMTRARTKGPTSTAATAASPATTRSSTGSTTSWTSMSSGAAASSRSAAPPASAVNAMT